MKQILMILAVVALVGCGGGKQEETQDPSQPEPATLPQATEKPKPPKAGPTKLIADPNVEKAIREKLKKPTGELTKADLEKVTYLDFSDNQLTDVKGLEKLTKLKQLYLHDNQLTEVPKGLEKLKQLTFLRLEGNKLSDVKALAKLTQLRMLWLTGNQAITKAQIAELQKALPKCNITHHTATK